MKKVLVFVALVAIVAAAFTGCKKDNAKPSYSGAFTINTKSYSVTPMMWFDITVELGGTSATSYAISGSDINQDNSLSLSLSSKTVGEITVNSTNSVTLEIGEDSYTAKSGKISVTKFDANTIEGKFDCKFVKTGTTAEVAGTGSFSSQKLSL